MRLDLSASIKSKAASRQGAKSQSPQSKLLCELGILAALRETIFSDPLDRNPGNRAANPESRSCPTAKRGIRSFLESLADFERPLRCAIRDLCVDPTNVSKEVWSVRLYVYPLRFASSAQQNPDHRLPPESLGFRTSVPGRHSRRFLLWKWHSGPWHSQQKGRGAQGQQF